MFTLKDNVLEVTLPVGKTQEEILKDAERSFPSIERNCFGKNIKVFGRITTSLAMWLGHKLAHICKSVSIFDPKENKYVIVIKH